MDQVLFVCMCVFFIKFFFAPSPSFLGTAMSILQLSLWLLPCAWGHMASCRTTEARLCSSDNRQECAQARGRGRRTHRRAFVSWRDIDIGARRRILRQARYRQGGRRGKRIRARAHRGKQT
jgi:hypothetical protein